MADVALAIGMQPGKLPAKSSLQTSISIPRMWFADLSFAPYRAPESTCGPSIASSPYKLTVKHQG
jgi:hypothetical protein